MNDGLMRDPSGRIPTYQRVSQWKALIAVFIVIGTMPLGIFIAFQLPKDPRWLKVAVSIGPFLVMLVLMFVWMHRKDRARKLAIAEALRADGFEALIKPDQPTAAAHFGPVAHLQSVLVHGADRLIWIASKDMGGASVRLFEHQYTTGSGKSTQVHQHTVIAWPAPAGWPIVTLNRTGAMARWFDRRAKRQDIEVGQEEFDKMWRIACPDEAFVKAMLAGQARSVLLNSPKGESWIIGNGFVCCLTTGVLNAENLRVFMNRSKAFLAGMPRGVWSADDAARV